jgi:hypothetical protein
VTKAVRSASRTGRHKNCWWPYSNHLENTEAEKSHSQLNLKVGRICDVKEALLVLRDGCC